jgi:transcriptional regulator GlxA family with amidase domain
MGDRSMNGTAQNSSINSAFGRPTRIAFVLFDQFSTIAFGSAIEPLNLANRHLGQRLFDWSTHTMDDKPVRSSSALSFSPDASLEELHEADIILLVSGLDVEMIELDPAFVRKLRVLAARGTIIGSLCTAAHILARLKLLNGYRCTIHWENIRSLREEFPHIDVSSTIFELDRNRMTCAGGTASLDMMLLYIAQHICADMARSIAEQLLHQTIRTGEEEQRYDLESRLGVSNRTVIGAISMMHDHIEDPLSCNQIASIMGISSRQLERLFTKYFCSSPGRYYMRLRLDAARELLRRTRQSILEVSLATGFTSTSHFTRCYRETFGHTPSRERHISIWTSNSTGEVLQPSRAESKSFQPSGLRSSQRVGVVASPLANNAIAATPIAI